MRLSVANFGPLAPYLLDLAAAFQARDLPLLLVGGSGLLLRRQWRLEEGATTLISAVPPSRTTDDFDVLLRLEVLADTEQRLAIRQVLTELGYQTHAQNFQFIRPDSGDPVLGRREVKVDFLAPLPSAGMPALKVSSHRVKARKSSEHESLHGFATPEALLTDAPTFTLRVEGVSTDGTERRGEVMLPHPFTLIVMKLHAFRDAHLGNERHPDPRPELARKHVADVYALVALLTQEEEQTLSMLGQQYGEEPATQQATGIVRSLLFTPNAPGTLVLREALSISPEDLELFLDVLFTTFPG